MPQTAVTLGTICKGEIANYKGRPVYSCFQGANQREQPRGTGGGEGEALQGLGMGQGLVSLELEMQR